MKEEAAASTSRPPPRAAHMSHPPASRHTYPACLIFIFFSVTKNSNRISILPQNYASFYEQYSVRVRSRIGIAKKIMYEKGKIREKQRLIHLSETF
jgi:hypothetical protein